MGKTLDKTSEVYEAVLFWRPWTAYHSLSKPNHGQNLGGL